MSKCLYRKCVLFTPTAFFEYKEDGGRFPNPPSYNVATTLPSYDEAERSKAEAAVPLVTGRVSVTLVSLCKVKDLFSVDLRKWKLQFAHVLF